MKKQVCLRIEEATDNALAKLAREQEISKNDLMNLALREKVFGRNRKLRLPNKAKETKPEEMANAA
jgi:hypothetical protein